LDSPGTEVWTMKRLFCLSACLVVYVMACTPVLGDATQGQAPTVARARWASARKPPRPKLLEGFEMRRVGSRYEPIVHELSKETVFRLPDTHMTFAAYAYIVKDDNLPEPRYGFLLDDGRFYYIDELDEPVDEPRYGLTDDYFVVDGYAFMSSHRTSMYLFKHGKDSVELCDVVEDPYIAHHLFVFTSDYPGEPAYGHESTVDGTDKTPVWLVRDTDGRSRPLIRIRLYLDPNDPDLDAFYEKEALDLNKYEEFHLYLKVVAPKGRSPRLRVARDPEIYKPLFDSLKEAGEHGVRPVAYYIYGFLAGRLDLPRIKAELPDNKVRKYIVGVLNNVGKWDAAFHDRSQPIPKIVEYRLKRR